nr:PREDICTED: transcription factor HES-1-like isoform X1 [Bemisia tabaci]
MTEKLLEVKRKVKKSDSDTNNNCSEAKMIGSPPAALPPSLPPGGAAPPLLPPKPLPVSAFQAKLTKSNFALPTSIMLKDGKRANKPLMEKRRRARINKSLAVLKTLILDSARTEKTKHSKLEKADILELTVRHLQREKTLNSEVKDKYRSGFQECITEVRQFLESAELYEGVKDISDTSVKQRLLHHLDACASEIDLDFSNVKCDESMELFSDPIITPKPEPDSSTALSSEESIKHSSQSSLMNGRKSRPKKSDKKHVIANSPGSKSPTNQSMSIVQVIPSRLPDGQVVFLLPSQCVQVNSSSPTMGSEPYNENEPLDFSVKRDENDPMWRPW